VPFNALGTHPFVRPSPCLTRAGPHGEPHTRSRARRAPVHTPDHAFVRTIGRPLGRTRVDAIGARSSTRSARARGRAQRALVDELGARSWTRPSTCSVRTRQCAQRAPVNALSARLAHLLGCTPADRAWETFATSRGQRNALFVMRYFLFSTVFSMVKLSESGL
jgi:hypothetical protein